MSTRFDETIEQLRSLGNEQTKKIYMNHGAREPLFGITIQKLKPIAKKIKTDQALAEELFMSGNFDAMYLAGMISDPQTMTEVDFERWISKSYCYMIGEWTVSIVLTDSPLAVPVALKWIDSGDDTKMSAGWATFCWLLGYKKDDFFDKDMIATMLERVRNNVHDSPNRTRYHMSNFVSCVGISYLPLHMEAVAVAESIGNVMVDQGNTSCKVPRASEQIAKATSQNRLGFKRKSTRC